MRNLGEQVVHDVGADVVVNLVEDAVVAVNRGQAAPQVGPLLPPVPGNLLVGVRGAMVVEVGDQIEPDDVDPVRHAVEGHRHQGAEFDSHSGQDGDEGQVEEVGGADLE